MGGRTIAMIHATMRRSFHKLSYARKPRGVGRLRSPMVLSTHGSGRARGEREEQRAWACRLAAGGHAPYAKMPLVCWDRAKAGERVGIERAG